MRAVECRKPWYAYDTYILQYGGVDDWHIREWCAKGQVRSDADLNGEAIVLLFDWAWYELIYVFCPCRIRECGAVIVKLYFQRVIFCSFNAVSEIPDGNVIFLCPDFCNCTRIAIEYMLIVGTVSSDSAYVHDMLTYDM